MRLDKIVTKRDDDEVGDILSAVWHWMIFLCLKKFTGSISVEVRDGKVVGIMENGESVPANPVEINKKMRLGRCKNG